MSVPAVQVLADVLRVGVFLLFAFYHDYALLPNSDSLFARNMMILNYFQSYLIFLLTALGLAACFLY